MPTPNERPRSTLCGLVQRHGLELAQDPRRCKALLNDLCGEYRLEVNLLVAAHESGIPNAMLQARRGVPPQALVAQMTRRLHDDRGIAEGLALWAVVSWALALNVISAVDLRAVGELPADKDRPPRGPTRRVVVPDGPPLSTASAHPINSVGDLWRKAIFPELGIWAKESTGEIRRVGRLATHTGHVGMDVAEAVLEFNPLTAIAAARRAVIGAVAGALWMALAGTLAGLAAWVGTLGYIGVAEYLPVTLSFPPLAPLREFMFWGGVWFGASGAVFGALVQVYREFGDPGGALLGAAGGVALGWLVEMQSGTGWATGLFIGGSIGTILGFVLLGTGLVSRKRTLDYVGQALWTAVRKLVHPPGWSSVTARAINGGIFALVLWLGLTQLIAEGLVAAELTGALVGFVAGAIGANKI